MQGNENFVADFFKSENELTGFPLFRNPERYYVYLPSTTLSGGRLNIYVPFPGGVGDQPQGFLSHQAAEKFRDDYLFHWLRKNDGRNTSIYRRSQIICLPSCMKAPPSIDVLPGSSGDPSSQRVKGESISRSIDMKEDN